MPMFLSPDAKQKLMSFIVSKTVNRESDSKDKGEPKEEEETEMSGSLFAAEDMMSAIKSNDAKAFNEGLSKWFDMRPSESSESYSDEDV